MVHVVISAAPAIGRIEPSGKARGSRGESVRQRAPVLPPRRGRAAPALSRLCAPAVPAITQAPGPPARCGSEPAKPGLPPRRGVPELVKTVLSRVVFRNMTSEELAESGAAAVPPAERAAS